MVFRPATATTMLVHLSCKHDQIHEMLHLVIGTHGQVQGRLTLGVQVPMGVKIQAGFARAHFYCVSVTFNKLHTIPTDHTMLIYLLILHQVLSKYSKHLVQIINENRTGNLLATLGG